MNARLQTMISIAATLFSANVVAAQVNPEWRVLRDPSGAYAMRYPAALKLLNVKGQTCTAGSCRPIEQINLVGTDGSMTLVIQRNINPKHLAVREWYESLAGRALKPETESVVTIGGRDAIRRSGLVPAESVHMVNGSEASRSSVLRYDNTTFVRLNTADILTIKVDSRSQSSSATFDKMLGTVSFDTGNP